MSLVFYRALSKQLPMLLLLLLAAVSEKKGCVDGELLRVAERQVYIAQVSCQCGRPTPCLDGRSRCYLSDRQKTALNIENVHIIAEAPLLGLAILEAEKDGSVTQQLDRIADLSVDDRAVFASVEEDKPIVTEGRRLRAVTHEAFPSSDHQQQWPLHQLNVQEAWTYSEGSPSIKCGVIDTGLDVNHPDLVDALWTNPAEAFTHQSSRDGDGNGVVGDTHGANFVSFPPDGDLTDEDGHGTHVAGIIAARGAATGRSMKGLAKVKLMGCKALGRRGIGRLSNAIRCMQYLLSEGADIIVASWGTYDYSRAMEESVKSAEDLGVVIVTAAGNDGNDNDHRAHFPSGFRSASLVSVAATSRDGALWDSGDAGSSNFGAKVVDIGAPGTEIYSTYTGRGYAIMEGSSQAAPHVAGVAALLMSYYLQKGLAVRGSFSRAARIVRHLLHGASCTKALSGKVAVGGQLDAGAAMRIAAQHLDEAGGSPRDCVVDCGTGRVLVEPSNGGADCPAAALRSEARPVQVHEEQELLAKVPPPSTALEDLLPSGTTLQGKSNDNDGSSRETSPDPEIVTPDQSSIDCALGPWSEWSGCSSRAPDDAVDVLCGRRRTRVRLFPLDAAGEPCSPTKEVEVLPCSPKQCDPTPSARVHSGRGGDIPGWLNGELFG